MTSRRSGYRANRRPRVQALSTRPTDFLEHTLTAACSGVAAAPEPKDCPRCNGAGAGCGMCGGLGFVPTEEWATLVQLAFAAACGLVPPCEGTGDAA